MKHKLLFTAIAALWLTTSVNAGLKEDLEVKKQRLQQVEADELPLLQAMEAGQGDQTAISGKLSALHDQRKA